MAQRTEEELLKSLKEFKPLSDMNDSLLKEPLLTSPYTANRVNRVWAKLIDLILFLTIYTLTELVLEIPFLIFLVGIVFFSSKDCWGRGQSPGKWLMGLNVLCSRTNSKKLNIYYGLLRNFPFVILSLSLSFNGFWLYLFTSLTVILLCIETYFVLSVTSGLRVGDILSHSRVFDYKDRHTRFLEKYLSE